MIALAQCRYHLNRDAESILKAVNVRLLPMPCCVLCKWLLSRWPCNVLKPSHCCTSAEYIGMELFLLHCRPFCSNTFKAQFSKLGDVMIHIQHAVYRRC